MKISKLYAAMMSMLAAVALTLTLSVMMAPRASADEHDQCRERVRHAEHELHAAIDKHGPQSREAEHKRHDLNEAREWCYKHDHGWWDEQNQRWHSERDWEGHDRDHDHDQH